MIAFVQSARIQFLLGALISEDGCQYRVKPGWVQPQTTGAEEPSSVRGNPCLCRQPCFIQHKRRSHHCEEMAVQFGTRAQRGLLSTFGGSAASPPLVVVEL